MTDTTERAQVGWGFWLGWVFASSAGLAVGFAVAFAVTGAMVNAVGDAVVGAVAGAVGGAVVGASVGVAQWYVLQPLVSRAGWWVLASSVGLAVGFAVFEPWTLARPWAGACSGLRSG